MKPAVAISVVILLFLPLSASALVNINTATIAELDTLPGVGPATAEKIVNARPFSSVTDIENIQGIGGPGSKTYDDIIGLITISGATTVVVEDEEEDDPDTSKKASIEEKRVVLPVTGLRITAPLIAYVNQPVNFSVAPEDGVRHRLVRYHWSFGDGRESEESAPPHRYQHAGKYVVIVESYHNKETKIARHEIEILAPAISLIRERGGISITNEGEEEIDLNGLSVLSDDLFVFPKHTILLPGESVVVPPGMKTASLMDASGRTIAVEGHPVPTKRAATAGVVESPTIEEVSPPEVSKAGPTNALISTAHASENLAVPAAANETNETWPYLGLALLISLGVFSLFSLTQRSGA